MLPKDPAYGDGRWDQSVPTAAKSDRTSACAKKEAASLKHNTVNHHQLVGAHNIARGSSLCSVNSAGKESLQQKTSAQAVTRSAGATAHVIDVSRSDADMGRILHSAL